MKRFFDAKKDRLVYIGCKADREMWEKRWEKEDLRKIFTPKRRSSTEMVVVDITRKYLPASSKVLEGGCGLGYYVHLIGCHGFEVTGVDYAEKTIEKVKSVMPSLDVRCGNLESLQFDSNYFDGYWSFGVIEHFYDGYEKIAREMHRVLRPGGYLFLAVPAFSKLRRIKAAFRFFPEFHEGKADLGNFYQFALSSKEVIEGIENNGFEFLEKKGWDAYRGMLDEIPGSRLVVSLLYRIMDGITERCLQDFCNHMNIYVFRKNAIDVPPGRSSS